VAAGRYWALHCTRGPVDGALLGAALHATGGMAASRATAAPGAQTVITGNTIGARCSAVQCSAVSPAGGFG
jgi:hypothetical protein